MLTFDRENIRPILEPTKHPFYALVRSIIYQQLSGKAAASILKKFIALFPGKKYPTPAGVLALSDRALRNAGLSGQKISYVKDLSEKFIDGTINPKKFSSMSDEDIKEHLVKVKGIGPWTVDMFLIFALNRPNVLPVGDLAIRKGFQKAFKLKSIPTEKDMRKLAKPHDGEHTILSLYLWNIMDDGSEW
jgi:DNA-3-methyladenine glycosylase II